MVSYLVAQMTEELDCLLVDYSVDLSGIRLVDHMVAQKAKTSAAK
jgi:hypothetical protein